MKIIQKYQSGYGITPVTYTPQQRTLSDLSGGGASAPSSDSSSKGENELLSENMIKLLAQNSLSSDMKKFVSDSQLFGSSLFSGGFDFGNTGLRVKTLLTYLTDMSRQKKLFDDGLNIVKEVGGASEVAIAPGGGGVYVIRDNKIQMVGVNGLKDGERPLSNLELAQIRESSPSAAFSTGMTMALSNATSMKEIRRVIDDQLKGLGTTTSTASGFGNPYRLTNESASFFKSLELSPEELSGMSLDQIYKVTRTSETQMDRVDAVLNGIYENLTPSMITLLQLRAKQLGIKDINVMLTEYISKYLNHKKSLTLDIESTLSPDGKRKSSSSKGEDGLGDMELTNPQLLITGMGYYKTFDIVNGGQMGLHLTGVELPLTKGKGDPMGQTTLAEVTQSDYAGILDFNNVSMGDQFIKGNLWDRVAITNGNIIRVDLPIDKNAEGLKPDLNSLNRLEEAQNELRQLGISIDEPSKMSNEDMDKVNKIYAKHNLPYLYSNGTINTVDYHSFAVLKGQAEESAFTDSDNEVLKGTLLDVTNDNEREGFQRIISRYDSKYKLNNGWGPFGGDKVFEGSIYIPITGNVISAGASSKGQVTADEAMQITARTQDLARRPTLSQVYQKGTSNTL